MELKKLYGDLTVLLGREIPTYTFLLYVDLCAQNLLCRYPKKLILPVGEYVPPRTLAEALPLADAFYTALLYAIAGSVVEKDAWITKSDTAAEEAYRSLWRADAKGKRRKGDAW